MSAGQLIARLRSLGIEIAAAGGRLRVSAARGKLTETMKQAIAAQKDELLDLMTQAPTQQDAELVRISRAGSLPLSLFQERLWVIHRLDPGSVAYNMVTAWQLDGVTDAAHVELAIRDIVRCHEILRARFRDERGRPRMHVLPPDAVPIVHRDLTTLALSEQEQAILADRHTAVHTPFDLQAEAPLRFCIYRLPGDGSVVLTSVHHIAFDEWSLALLHQELLAACKRSHPGHPPALQYADFAQWQRASQEPRAIATELQWWQRRLSGIPDVCTFPADHMATTDRSGTTHPFCWSSELSSRLRAMVREAGATLYMALLAACAVVLRAYTGQGDIVLGSPMGMRERPEFETMLGPFVNLMVLRLDLTDDPTFAELLLRARDAVLDCHDHRQVPFETLVERLNPARSWDHSPLFQVAVVLHNTSDRPAAPIYSGSALYDFTWFAREVEGKIEGSFEYRSDLYDAATIARIATQLEAVLQTAVAKRDLRVSEIPLLSTAELHLVLETFNATTFDFGAATFVARFERQVRSSGADIAIEFQGTSIAYAELNGRVNRLARHLRSVGVAPGIRVGICMTRSIEMVIALIAVQKAGAAYVPLDPAFPSERLNFMVADSGMTTLITAGGAAARLQAGPSVRIIDLAAEETAIAGMDASDPGSVASAQDIAYVIYTSGSTGTPNGVAVSHGALANLLCAMQQAPGMAATDRLAAVTTISFDIAALELYLPLMVGARIELVPSGVVSDGHALAALLSTSQATMLQATPATWRLLVEAGWSGPPGFRALCGGDSLPGALAESLLQRVGELWNLYGPTETTVWSTAGRIENPAAVNVGRPIANTRIYVLDAALRPTPIGVPGDIWIGGAGLAIGYHNRHELTATRFVADPFSRDAGARMYRTGDVGRWTSDGRLLHMGRADRQVKLHGYRIELEEIETALSRLEGVRQAVVTMRDAGGNDARLVGCLVYQLGADLTSGEIRSKLRRLLPEYMIPSIFVVLERIPLTPNGKVDHAALPDPFKHALRGSSNSERPAPGMEELVAQVWQELLQIDRIGALDNFFELGGNSLLALRVTATIEARTGHRLEPRALFFQNLRDIAAGLQRIAVEQAHI
ncbi:MAG TPA: amino acid adenylation domain-containing protein [Acetobacteraceae bacterium]